MVALSKDDEPVGIPPGYCWTPGALIASGPLTGDALHLPYFAGSAWVDCGCDYGCPSDYRAYHDEDDIRARDDPYGQAACHPSSHHPLYSEVSFVFPFAVGYKTIPGQLPSPAAKCRQGM